MKITIQYFSVWRWFCQAHATASNQGEPLRGIRLLSEEGQAAVALEQGGSEAAQR